MSEGESSPGGPVPLAKTGIQRLTKRSTRNPGTAMEFSMWFVRRQRQIFASLRASPRMIV
jgi:hypothetical protein